MKCYRKLLHMLRSYERISVVVKIFNTLFGAANLGLKTAITETLHALSVCITHAIVFTGLQACHFWRQALG